MFQTLHRFILAAILPLIACQSAPGAQPSGSKQANPVSGSGLSIPDTAGKVAGIPLPPGYSRVKPAGGSFGEYLGNITLKKDKTVYLYDGSPKGNQEAQYAVLDVSVGKRDLQQCADAIMRLRAEYFYQQGRFREIVFRDNNGKVYQFTPPYNRVRFYKYLDRVFGMCGSASLSQTLKPVPNPADIQHGDVFIKGGFPGHAVLVMDIAQNKEGKKIFLLAQSYMPAQDIHILRNPGNPNSNPWYPVNNAPQLETPEWTFTKQQLKRW